MKKSLNLLIVILLITKFASAQHFIPVDLLTNARNVNVAIYGGLSLDAGNGAELIKSLSNTGQTGFVVNALFRTLSGRNGSTETFHQFIVDLNPLIINWDPFTWNKLVKQPVDSFSVNKLPFQEDALLHIGWHKNYLSKFYAGGKNQLQNTMIFGEMYFRPYNIKMQDSIENNYRFSVFNVNTGVQYSYLKKEVPVLGNFLIGLALQMNFMLTNESDAYLGSMSALMGSSYQGRQYWGPGAKIVVQTNNLNIYVEGREYYSFDTGNKFTQEPIILVGASGNLKFKKYKNKKSTNVIRE